MWDKIERRKEAREFCSQHQQQSNDIVEIKTILKNIEKVTTQGITFKTAIVGSMIAMVLLFIGQVFLHGKLVEKVDRNTGIIEKQGTRIELLQERIK